MNPQMTTYTKINHLETRNPGDSCMLYGHDDGTASVCRTHNIHSSDVIAIVAHANKQSRTMGFSFLYAVRGASVICLMKRGRFAQHDLRPFVTDGYTEFFYSCAFATKVFMLADGTIVPLDRQVDCSPKKTTAEVLRWRNALG